MRRTQEKIHKKNNLRYFYMVLIIVSTIFTFNITTSRYLGEIGATKEILGIPVLTLSNNNQQYTVTDFKPGDTKTYEFIVSNVDGEQKNEMLLKYTIDINAETTVPVTFNLYDITNDETTGVQVPLTNNKTAEINMKAVETDSDIVTRKYRLSIIWNESDNSYTYAEQTISCSIDLEAVQAI